MIQHSNCFEVEPSVATAREAVIAKCMHRVVGLNGKLPKSTMVFREPGENQRLIMDFIGKNPGVTRTEVVRGTGIKRSSVDGAMDRMVASGDLHFTRLKDFGSRTCTYTVASCL